VAGLVGDPPHGGVPCGDGVGGAVQAGRTLSLGTGLTADRDRDRTDSRAVSVNIDQVNPRVTWNTAAASISVLLCRKVLESAGIGVVGGDLSAYCARLDPAAGSRTSLMSQDEQIIVQVMGRRPGTVRIAGFDITYRGGIRRGTQRGGTEVTVTVK
jgi:hypothetical protein